MEDKVIIYLGGGLVPASFDLPPTKPGSAARSEHKGTALNGCESNPVHRVSTTDEPSLPRRRSETHPLCLLFSDEPIYLMVCAGAF